MGLTVGLTSGRLMMIGILGVWNLIAVFMMGADKHRARRNRWRIPEERLMLVALLGAALGIFTGMHLFHHKTKHPKFYIGVPLLFVVNCFLLYELWKALA